MLKGLDLVLSQQIFVEQLQSAWHWAEECGGSGSINMNEEDCETQSIAQSRLIQKFERTMAVLRKRHQEKAQRMTKCFGGFPKRQLHWTSALSSQDDILSLRRRGLEVASLVEGTEHGINKELSFPGV